MSEKLHTPASLAKKLQVSRSSVYRWIQEGCPTEIRQHKLVRLDYDKVMEWLNERGNDA